MGNAKKNTRHESKETKSAATCVFLISSRSPFPAREFLLRSWRPAPSILLPRLPFLLHLLVAHNARAVRRRRGACRILMILVLLPTSRISRMPPLLWPAPAMAFFTGAMVVRKRSKFRVLAAEVCSPSVLLPDGPSCRSSLVSRRLDLGPATSRRSATKPNHFLGAVAGLEDDGSTRYAIGDQAAARAAVLEAATVHGRKEACGVGPMRSTIH